MDWQEAENRVVPVIAQLAGVSKAQRVLTRLTGMERNEILVLLAKAIREGASDILTANLADCTALSAEKSQSFRERLELTPSRVSALARSVEAVVAQEDPIGEVVFESHRPDELVMKRVRAPIGTLLVIFESRPNVAIDAFALAIKSGNAIILRGGSEAKETLGVLYRIIAKALVDSNRFATEAVPFLGIENYDRALIPTLLSANEQIDLVIPRGGEGLIRFVCENTEIPVLKNDRGLCHVYVHSRANLDWALNIVKNAKTQRPGVCNSMETLLVDKSIASKFLPMLSEKIDVQWRCCPESLKLVTAPRKSAAKDTDWDTEHLDLILNCRVVNGFSDAIEHIAFHGSKHSEAIITDDSELAEKFTDVVDAAAVYVNASTRFTDGGEMGLGAEIGISTQKIHVRGPIGARELTTPRWIVHGKGAVRK